MGSRLEELERRAAERLAQAEAKADARLDQAEARVADERGSAGADGEHYWRFEEASSRDMVERAGSGDASFFRVHAEELEQITGYIFQAPHVQSNAMYRATAGKTVLRASMGDHHVNAFATVRGGTPLIMILGGCAVFSRLCGLSLAVEQVRKDSCMGRLCSKLGASLLALQGTMPVNAAEEFARQIGIVVDQVDAGVRRRAHSTAAGLMGGIIAHELGHLVLGHVMGPALNYEISRNMEREADSFASSVINSSPWGDYCIAGLVMWNVALAWQEHIGGSGKATTHPESGERALDLLRANEAQVRQAGLTEAMLRDALPK